MMSQWMVMSATFAAISTALLAVFLFARDLLFGGRVDTQRKRLETLPEEPEGGINRWIFHLVEESGVSFDTATFTAMLGGASVVGMGALFVVSDNLLAAAAGAVIGPLFPLFYVLAKRWFRVGNMRRNLPLALQAVADAVRSGQTLEEACELAARDVPGPLGSEFAFAKRQLELGQSPISVMNRMSIRVPLHEFRIFSTAVVVHRCAGGNLSLLTQRMAMVSRDRQDVRSHLMAVTAGSQLSAVGMIVGVVLAAAALFWLEPEYIGKFVTHPKGPMLLTIAGILELIGVIWVWCILRVQY